MEVRRNRFAVQLRSATVIWRTYVHGINTGGCTARTSLFTPWVTDLSSLLLRGKRAVHPDHLFNRHSPSRFTTT
jgi:hypothetical protein